MSRPMTPNLSMATNAPVDDIGAPEDTGDVEESISIDGDVVEDFIVENDDDDVEDDDDADYGEMYLPKRATSRIWNWFRAWTKRNNLCHCLICTRNISYGKSKSSSKLIKHLERHHSEQHSEYLNCDAVEVNKDYDQNSKSENNKRKVQATMHTFVESGVNFPEAYVRWMCETYQPIDTCENEYFRKMIATCNAKIKPLACDRVHTILKQKIAVCRASLKEYLKGKQVLFLL
jgi:hypothetical protein